VSKWSPPEEKGKFISALLGSLLGTVFTWSSLGVIMQHFGWKFGFYIPAVIGIVITFFWYIIVADSPEDHARITKAEKDMIVKSLGGTVSKQKQLPPVTSILTSIPFCALMILHYGSLWGLYFLMNAAPMFMTQALNFNLAKAGFLSALPPLARLISGFIFGSIGDYLRRRNLFAVTTIRKSFCLFCKFTKKNNSVF
jgi:MFS transporter, ACS family, solute carrier family 17 (sodium-dependent inorganic phosphate cotransporter), other